MFAWSMMEWILETCFDFRPYQQLYQGRDHTYRSDKETPTVQNDPNDTASEYDSEDELPLLKEPQPQNDQEKLETTSQPTVLLENT